MKLYLHSNIIDSLENIEKNGTLLVENNKEKIDIEIGRYCRSRYPGMYYCRTTYWEDNNKKIKSIDFGSYTEFLIYVE